MIESYRQFNNEYFARARKDYELNPFRTYFSDESRRPQEENERKRRELENIKRKQNINNFNLNSKLINFS